MQLEKRMKEPHTQETDMWTGHKTMTTSVCPFVFHSATQTLTSMGDPVSATASILATMSFAGESCKFLFEFFRAVSGAPKEVQQHVTSLHALRSTFSSIESLSKDISLERELSQEFHVELKGCMADIQATELKVRKISEDLERSKLRRTWTRLKWSSSAEHWLSKFFTRVHLYHATFCLDLQTLQMFVS